MSGSVKPIPTKTETLGNYSKYALALLVRVVLGTWVALIGIMIAHMAWIQALPDDWVIKLNSVYVDTNGPEPVVVINRWTPEDTPILFSAELRDYKNPSYQPCVHVFRGIADALEGSEVRIPLANMMGTSCNLKALSTTNKKYVFAVMYIAEMDYGIMKRASKVSGPFTLYKNKKFK